MTMSSQNTPSQESKTKPEMSFLNFILKGNLFLPLALAFTGFFIYMLFFQVDGHSLKYNRKRITIPMENFIVPPPAKPKAKTKKMTAPKQSQEQDSSNEVDLTSLKRLYLTHMVQKINQAKRYPRYELRNNKEGAVKVKLTLNKDGTVRSLHIIQPSRFSAFNDEAKAAIHRAAPFGRFPKLLPDEQMSVIFNIVFRLS